ncbi:MAG: hypothetical protein U1F48_00720 [Burkholderiales bacterium]
MNLRAGLGNYAPRSDAKLTENALTLHDLSELIRRGGLQAGFIVESQFNVKPAAKNVRKVDWVWLNKSDPRTPVVAFEIEGRDVHPDCVAADVDRMRTSGARLRVIALYQVDHNRVMMRNPPFGCAPKAWVKKHAGKSKVSVFLDEELMMPNGIEAVVRDAQTKASVGR